jgi:hypothetical protein
MVDELVSEVDDEALLASAAEAWGRMVSQPDALAVYRAETRELEGFGARLPDD